MNATMVYFFSTLFYLWRVLSLRSRPLEKLIASLAPSLPPAGPFRGPSPRSNRGDPVLRAETLIGRFPIFQSSVHVTRMAELRPIPGSYF